MILLILDKPFFCTKCISYIVFHCCVLELLILHVDRLLVGTFNIRPTVQQLRRGQYSVHQ